jgi:hypothetical protein
MEVRAILPLSFEGSPSAVIGRVTFIVFLAVKSQIVRIPMTDSPFVKALETV